MSAPPRRGASAAVMASRRWATGVAALVLALACVGCRQKPKKNGPLRLGFLPNVTHAQALVGVRDGTFQRALGETPLKVHKFNAGPAAMEAILGDSLDVCFVGAGPALIAYVRSERAVRVIAGAASGGAVLVGRVPQRPEALAGKRLAVPQIGNTQDIALRSWLKRKGLRAQVVPLSNADILSLFKRGALDGAWVPEPWGARIVSEANGHILLDERALWKDGVFPTTVMIATEKALRERRAEVLAVLKAHVELTERAQADPAAFATAANEAFGALTKKPLPPAVLSEAFSRITLTTNPMEPQLAKVARDAEALGYLPDSDVRGLVDVTLLRELKVAPEGAPAGM
jgi:NitT/TauT family transport system substrate-binding protein